MSSWDTILPHRLLINRSLRKASEGLRSRVDEYQLEYDRKIERCTVEIEQAAEDKNRNFENIKLSLQDELSKDSDFFDSVQAGLLEYADMYLRSQYLYKMQEIKRLERQTLVEYGDFLTKQMGLIGEEIDILEARKAKLVLQAKVDDVIELIGLSGCELAIGSNDDASTLLAKVSESLDACDSDDRLTKFSLLRLRVVLQERADFLPMIQYISWTIQQKIQLSRQLSTERRKINSDKDEKKDELRQVNESLGSLKRLLEEQARTVREYWAIPITQLNVQISFNEKTLKALFDSVNGDQARLRNLFSELKDTNQQIQQMIDSRSDDSSKWERLQRQKAAYRDDISSTKARIDRMQGQISQIKSELAAQKNTRKQWLDRRQMVYSLCKRNNVYLISDNNSQETDECRIIHKRLTELYRIEEVKLAEQRFQEESAQIQEHKEEKVTEITVQIDSAIKSQAKKCAIFKQASAQLTKSKSADKRFFLSKLFSDTEEVAIAKQALKDAETQKKSADDHLSKLKAELAKIITDFDGQIESARPIPYRPTAREKEEIQQLENRKNELMDKQSKKISVRKEGYYDRSN